MNREELASLAAAIRNLKSLPQGYRSILMATDNLSDLYLELGGDARLLSDDAMRKAIEKLPEIEVEEFVINEPANETTTLCYNCEYDCGCSDTILKCDLFLPERVDKK